MLKKTALGFFLSLVALMIISTLISPHPSQINPNRLINPDPYSIPSDGRENKPH